MSSKNINVTKPSLPDFNDFSSSLRQIWESNVLSNNGKLHNLLETSLHKFTGSSELSIFTNGHIALEFALQALNLNGEVITTPFTFASTTHAIVRQGLTPVFCDIKLGDYTLDVSQIERLITNKTVAILPVHVYGNICDVNAIDKIAKKYNLKVIYDAAHVFAVEYKGCGIGSFGDISMFSFQATKVFHTIEGGALTFKDSSLKPVLESMKNFGITGPEDVGYIGGNAKMDEFRAAMGLSNLKNLDSEIAKRGEVVKRYHENLSNVPGIKLNQPQKDVKPNYAYMPVLFDGFKKTRNQVFEELKTHDIYARKYFYPLISDFACYKGRFDSSKTPVAKHVAENILTLPLYADLSLKDVDHICKIILN